MTPYERELQRVTVLQNAGNACVMCGGWAWITSPIATDFAKEPCPKCEGTGEAVRKEPA